MIPIKNTGVAGSSPFFFGEINPVIPMSPIKNLVFFTQKSLG